MVLEVFKEQRLGLKARGAQWAGLEGHGEIDVVLPLKLSIWSSFNVNGDFEAANVFMMASGSHFSKF